MQELDVALGGRLKTLLTYRDINALAESVNALCKTELVRGPARGSWRTIDDLELATLNWFHWHNNERLHSYLADLPPAEFEAVYDANISASALMEITV